MGFPLNNRTSREAAADLAAWRASQPRRPSILPPRDRGTAPTPQAPQGDLSWAEIEAVVRELGLSPVEAASMTGAELDQLLDDLENPTPPEPPPHIQAAHAIRETLARRAGELVEDDADDTDDDD